MCKKFCDVMTDKPGCTNLVKHKVDVITDEPVRERQNPLPFATQEAIEDETRFMVKEGIIEPSTSEFFAPVVLVGEPGGSYRFCVTFRKLNKVTRFDCEPMCRPEDILTKLGSKRHFSHVDFSRGFWQVEMEETSKSLTAFTTKSGCYQFKRMPFGLVNSPATFNRLLRKLLNGMCNVDNYVDDVLIHTSTWTDHIKTLEELMVRIRNPGLKIRPSKCMMGFETINFIGHTVGY